MKNTKTHTEMKKRAKEYLKVASAGLLLWATTATSSCAHLPKHSVIEQRLPNDVLVEQYLGKVGNMSALDFYIGLETGLVSVVDDPTQLVVYPINLEQRLKELPETKVDSLLTKVSYQGSSRHINRELLYKRILDLIYGQSIRP